MKAAIVVLTGQGLNTAHKIIEKWSHEEPPELWLNQRLKDLHIDKIVRPTSTQHHVNGAEEPSPCFEAPYLGVEKYSMTPYCFEHLKEVVPRIWRRCSLLIFIMATGIVVRQIAPYLQGKDRDPAVLVLDEKGEFVISLLSGHLGGANAWAKTVAQWLNAQPVVTTATDVQGLIAPDEYARMSGWSVEPVEGLRQVNRVLLEQGCLKVWTDCLPKGHPLRQDAHYSFVRDDDRDQAHIWITAQTVQSEKSKIHGNSIPLLLIPRIFSVGVGCRRGASREQIIEAITQSLEKLGISPRSVQGLFSIELKSDEVGIIETAQTLGVSFKTFSTQQIQEMNKKQGLIPSEFVKEKIGVDGVCEAASLLGTKQGELVLPKQKLHGVTVAISKERFL